MAVVINVPPMPKPEDFGINWVKAQGSGDWGDRDGREAEKAKIQAYEAALRAWERAVSALGKEARVSVG